MVGSNDARGMLSLSLEIHRLDPVQRPRPRGHGHVPDGEEAAPHQQGDLDHVGPDHGPDPAHHGVEGGDGPDADDDEHQGQPGGDGQRPGGEEHDHAHVDGHEQEEHGGSEKPHREVEPVFQVLVGGGEAEADEEGDGDEQNQHHGDGDARQRVQEDGEAETPDHPRGPQVGDAGEQSGDQAHPDRKPGHAAAAQEILLVAVLPLGQPPAQQHHAHEVGDQDQVIDDVKSHREFSPPDAGLRDNLLGCVRMGLKQAWNLSWRDDLSGSVHEIIPRPRFGITPQQGTEADGILGWSGREPAIGSGISVPNITHGRRTPGLDVEHRKALSYLA